MYLDLWAKRWNIQPHAIIELKQHFLSMCGSYPDAPKDFSEGAIQQRIRLEASKKGARLWRNNVGATYTDKGAFIRYGLANESQNINSRIKSADLIGIKPVLITQAHVGCVIGQFLSREVKHSKWKFSPANTRDAAQLAWAHLVASLGGDACIATHEGTI